MKFLAPAVAIVALLFAGRSAHAVEIATGAPVISASTTWNGLSGNNDANGFGWDRAVDGSTVEANGGSGYALWADGDPDRFFTLDLGAPFDIGTITIYNTHNSAFNDRSTGDFEIHAGNNVNPSATTGLNGGPGLELDLGTATLIASGTLPSTDGEFPVTTAFIANPANTSLGSFRYIRFRAVTIGAGDGAAGLNDLQIEQAIPEPTTIALAGIGALGMLAVAARRRTRS